MELQVLKEPSECIVLIVLQVHVVQLSEVGLLGSESLILTHLHEYVIEYADDAILLSLEEGHRLALRTKIEVRE
jgi:hypothetical protein